MSILSSSWRAAVRQPGPLFAGIVLALATCAATAQLSVAVGAGGLIDGTPVPPPDCDQAFEVGTLVLCNRSGADGAQFSSAALAQPGGNLLGASFARHDGAATGTIGSATASWTERVSFTPLTRPVIVRQWLDITGLQGTAALSGDGSEIVASTATFIRMNVYREGDFGDPTQFDELTVVRQRVDRGAGVVGEFTGIQRTRRGVTLPIDTVPGFPASPPFVFMLDAGTSFYDFTWNFATNASVAPGHSGEAWTRYERPAAPGRAPLFDGWFGGSLTGLQFFDEDGNDITATLNIVFASGASYPVGPPIPEPGTWALLAAGLTALGWRLRRKAGA